MRNNRRRVIVLKNYRLETEVIHKGYDSQSFQGSLTPPLFQSSTFTMKSAEQGERRFAGEEEGYVYSRLGNPTVTVLEERIAELEGGEAGLAFSSGMAAVSATLFGLVRSGDHILVSEGVYGCTYGLLELLKDRFNVDYDLIAMDEEDHIRSYIRPETKVIYVETPINPTMKLVDLELVCKLGKEFEAKVVVDNTFATPYLQRPITFGADVVVHSATKYISGHGDVVAGLMVGSREFVNEVRMTTQKDIGGIISPFDAWLLIRGLKTLPVRMDRHCTNAVKIAEKMKAHPKVKDIIFPGDDQFPQAGIVKSQMKQAGGMISFLIDGGKETAQRFMNELQLIKIAVSLGDAETLIQHPATMTHSVVPEEKREKMGIGPELIRLSVGLEAWEDIWADIEQALEKI
ncbi:methionine gamma-lyase [Alkalihalobacterium chitinilyticum]|uniref:L-methionine gamma-lyase n=1 Tax=Alkalihalobacterium chitinilyticum TaxID=2980103 RepID=A0ABT5VBF1_9BACI|nr:methionine gamma-lyase [Alkalihalobacterium chitinilyticum]MDE5412780.1 methionine gamma-lyase [Alkalihalobacterium chitinilyticum]